MKTPATVVTGFLGAGKTTLIRHLLSHAGGRRIALIVNEFGSVGVDGEILAACGVEGCADEDGPGVIELANGCICCTVADDFVPTIEALLGRRNPPEHIIIETSGLALPQPLLRAFAWPSVRTRVTVDGVVTVVDADALAAGRFAADEAAVSAQAAADDTLDHETPLSELFEDQLACADLVVLNKADLLDAATLDALEARLRAEARPGVAFLRAAQGAVSPAAALGLGVGAEDDLAAREAHHHHHDDDDHDDHDDHDHDDHDHEAFDSAVITLGQARDAGALAEACAAAAQKHGLFRVKGFAAVAGKPMRLVLQAVGPRVETYYDKPFAADAPRDTRLVVIGYKGFDAEAIAAEIRAATL